MVHTKQIEPTDRDEDREEDIIAAVLNHNVEPIPEFNNLGHGYELLSQEPDELDFFSPNNLSLRRPNQDENFFCHERDQSPPPDEDPPIIDNNSPPVGNPLPYILPVSEEIARETWSESSSSDIEMDAEKVEEVKQVMVNITLPQSAIPDWAANVPEDQWKEYLFNKLHIKQNRN